MREKGIVEAQPSTIAQHQFVVYEPGYVVVEELVEKSVTIIATGASEAEAEALARLVSRLRELGFNVARGATVDMVKTAAKYSKTSYETILSECKTTMACILYSALMLLQHTSVPEAHTLRAYREQIDTLMGRIRGATSASELLSILDDVVKVYEQVKKIPLDYSAYASTLVGLVDQALQKASGDAKRSLERLKQALELLRDRNRLVDLLARFYVLMDMVRDDTYRSLIASYGPYIDAALRATSGRATPLDFELAATGALILLELEEKGALKIEELPILRETERAVSERLGAGELRRLVMERLARYRESVSRGIEPGRDPLPYVQIAETLAMINPSRHIYSAVYGLASSLVPNNPTLAMTLASAVTYSVTSTVGTLLPPVGVALTSIAIVDSATDVGTRLANPVDRELFVKFLSEHWQDIAIAVAVGVAAGIVAAKLSSYVAQKVYPKLISVIEKKSPVLAEKVREILGAKLIEGRQISTERDVTVTVTDDGHVVVYERSAGTVKVLGKYKVPDKIYAALEDPEAAVKVGALLSKKGLVLWGTAGDDLVFLDEAGGVHILTVSGKKATIISDVIRVEDKVVTFSQLARENPEAFNYLYTVTRLAGLSLDDLSNNPEFTTLLRTFMQQGKAYGVATVKGVTFEFAGDKLFVRSGRATLATADLARLKEQVAALMDMAEFLKHFEAQLGTVYRNVLLDTTAFGYGLLSPQIVAYDEILRAITTSQVPPVDLQRILPPVEKAIGTYYVSGNKQLYVSNQLLGDAKILLETEFTREVVHGLLKTRFAERGVTTIQLPPDLQRLVAEAINKGASGLDAFAAAAHMAMNAGNNAGATTLLNLYILLSLSQYGLTSVEVFGSTSTGMVAGLTALNSTVLQASQRAAEALSRGEVETARQAIMSALIQTGLSEQAARQVANSVIGEARAVTAPITIPREVVEEKTLVAVKHEPVEKYTSESATRGIVVPVLKVNTEVEEHTVSSSLYEATSKHTSERAGGVVVPVLKVNTEVEERTISSPAYESANKYTSERARGVVEPVLEVNVETEERVTSSSNYESRSKYTKERARGVVIPVEHVSPEEREIVVPSSEYDKVEESAVEKVTATVVPVVREEVVPVLVVMTVDVEEEEEHPPTSPKVPPQTTGTGGPPLLWAPGWPGARGDSGTRGREERRGVGEREVLVY